MARRDHMAPSGGRSRLGGRWGSAIEAGGEDSADEGTARQPRAGRQDQGAAGSAVAARRRVCADFAMRRNGRRVLR
jgi:hypothetical protein